MTQHPSRDQSLNQLLTQLRQQLRRVLSPRRSVEIFSSRQPAPLRQKVQQLEQFLTVPPHSLSIFFLALLSVLQASFSFVQAHHVFASSPPVASI